MSCLLPGLVPQIRVVQDPGAVRRIVVEVVERTRQITPSPGGLATRQARHHLLVEHRIVGGAPAPGLEIPLPCAFAVDEHHRRVGAAEPPDAPATKPEGRPRPAEMRMLSERHLPELANVAQDDDVGVEIQRTAGEVAERRDAPAIEAEAGVEAVLESGLQIAQLHELDVCIRARQDAVLQYFRGHALRIVGADEDSNGPRAIRHGFRRSIIASTLRCTECPSARMA